MTMAYIGMCIGGAISAEMASGGLAQQNIVKTPCPRRPSPRPEGSNEDTADVDEAEQTNNSAIEARNAEIQARVLGLLCEIHSVIAPLLEAESGVDKDTLDLRKAVMTRFADDWMYTKELESMFDDGAFWLLRSAMPQREDRVILFQATRTSEALLITTPPLEARILPTSLKVFPNIVAFRA